MQSRRMAPYKLFGFRMRQPHQGHVIRARRKASSRNRILYFCQKSGVHTHPPGRSNSADFYLPPFLAGCVSSSIKARSHFL